MKEIDLILLFACFMGILLGVAVPFMQPPTSSEDHINELLMHYETEIPDNATITERINTIKSVCEIYDSNNQDICVHKLKQRIFNLSVQE